MTPRNWDEYVRTRYSGMSGSGTRLAAHLGDERRVVLQPGDPRIDKVEFERNYTRVDFDLDARDEIGIQVQKHRVSEVERLLQLTFEAGVEEGQRRTRTTVKEALGVRD